MVTNVIIWPLMSHLFVCHADYTRLIVSVTTFADKARRDISWLFAAKRLTLTTQVFGRRCFAIHPRYHTDDRGFRYAVAFVSIVCRLPKLVHLIGNSCCSDHSCFIEEGCC